jgi:hypothetical protein
MNDKPFKRTSSEESAIMRRMAVLPQPVGPSRVKNSPCSIEIETSFTASSEPKRRITLRISSSAVSGAPAFYRRRQANACR